MTAIVPQPRKDLKDKSAFDEVKNAVTDVGLDDTENTVVPETATDRDSYSGSGSVLTGVHIIR